MLAWYGDRDIILILKTCRITVVWHYISWYCTWTIVVNICTPIEDTVACDLVYTLSQLGFKFDSPNRIGHHGIISDGMTYGLYLLIHVSSCMLGRRIFPDELINRITQQGLHFYSPNLQNICNMTLARTILHFWLYWRIFPCSFRT